MPLRDHFHPPLSTQRHWEGFHNAWASTMAQQLNQELLPAQYFAEPHVHLGGQAQVDVATFEQKELSGPEDAPVATAVWAPSRPGLRVPIHPLPQSIEVQVFGEEGGPRLVAAIELVSPANKDRASSRKAFAIKCASYLQQGIGVVVVDVVTTRSANLHEDLLQLVEVTSAIQPLAGALYATAYRVVADVEPPTLEGWIEALTVDSPLPTLPLWLGPDSAVPLDLEQSYTAASDWLRLP